MNAKDETFWRSSLHPQKRSKNGGHGVHVPRMDHPVFVRLCPQTVVTFVVLEQQKKWWKVIFWTKQFRVISKIEIVIVLA
jgi:hypothetical protein